jgi:hypothetical protein
VIGLYYTENDHALVVSSIVHSRVGRQLGTSLGTQQDVAGQSRPRLFLGRRRSHDRSGQGISAHQPDAAATAAHLITTRAVLGAHSAMPRLALLVSAVAALALRAAADCCPTTVCGRAGDGMIACIVNPGWHCREASSFGCCGVGAWCVPPLCGTATGLTARQQYLLLQLRRRLH